MWKCLQGLLLLWPACIGQLHSHTAAKCSDSVLTATCEVVHKLHKQLPSCSGYMARLTINYCKPGHPPARSPLLSLHSIQFPLHSCCT
jgi:hypothetical protein